MSRIITIRNMPEELEKRIETLADEEGLSLAQTVIRLLLRATGLPESGGGHGRPKRNHDLDELAGTWSANDAAEFDRSLAEQRRIDPDPWT
ncbi:MAG: hypothetical protein ACODAA_00585 [Gemmatimonadota bacterium]